MLRKMIIVVFVFSSILISVSPAMAQEKPIGVSMASNDLSFRYENGELIISSDEEFSSISIELKGAVEFLPARGNNWRSAIFRAKDNTILSAYSLEPQIEVRIPVVAAESKFEIQRIQMDENPWQSVGQIFDPKGQIFLPLISN